MTQQATLDPEELNQALACAQSVEQFLRRIGEQVAAVTAVNEQLSTSIESRALIDQAMGVIMAIRRCSQDEALATLRQASQNQNVKLRDIARAIVADVTGEPPGQPAPFEHN